MEEPTGTKGVEMNEVNTSKRKPRPRKSKKEKKGQSTHTEENNQTAQQQATQQKAEQLPATTPQKTKKTKKGEGSISDPTVKPPSAASDSKVGTSKSPRRRQRRRQQKCDENAQDPNVNINATSEVVAAPTKTSQNYQGKDPVPDPKVGSVDVAANVPDTDVAMASSLASPLRNASAELQRDFDGLASKLEGISLEPPPTPGKSATYLQSPYLQPPHEKWASTSTDASAGIYGTPALYWHAPKSVQNLDSADDGKSPAVPPWLKVIEKSQVNDMDASAQNFTLTLNIRDNHIPWNYVPRRPSPDGMYDVTTRTCREAPRRSPRFQNAGSPASSNVPPTQFGRLDPQFRAATDDSSNPQAPKPMLNYLKNAAGCPSKLIAHPQPLLIILDLNGTLVFRPKKSNAIHPRPGLEDFLEYLFDNHVVMFWTSAMPHNMERMLDRILTPEQRHKCAAAWSREHLNLSKADYNGKVQVYKQLRVVWNDKTIAARHPYADKEPVAVPAGADMYGTKPLATLAREWNQTNTLIVDDSLLKTVAEPFNHVCIPELDRARLIREQQEWEVRYDTINGEPLSPLDVLQQVARYIRSASWRSDVSQFCAIWPFVFESTNLCGDERFWRTVEYTARDRWARANELYLDS